MLLLGVEGSASRIILLVFLNHLQDFFSLGTYEALIVFGEVGDCLLLNYFDLECLRVESLLF